jgi:hypothetical protein
MHLAAPLMLTGHYTAFVFIIIGQECIPILSVCARRALVASFQTQ